jgi:quinol monooxygenase YgiN
MKSGLNDQQRWRAVMSKLEVSARMRIRKGKLDDFKQQAAECIRETKEKDTKTLRYDWFVSSDGTACEIREAYDSSERLIKHHWHISDALNKLFSEFADNHEVTVYGDASPQLIETANARMKDRIKWYSFLQGLERIS